jgi:hypothetical protein
MHCYATDSVEVSGGKCARIRTFLEFRSARFQLSLQFGFLSHLLVTLCV